MKRRRLYSIVIVVAAITLAVGGVSLQIARKSEKEKTLIYQLQVLRQGIQIYMQVNKQKPPSLVAVLDAQYSFGHPLQWKFGRDPLGVPVDPFGEPFQYDAATGWIHSATSGYEGW